MIRIFEVLGKIRSKERPRINRYTMNIYTPTGTKSYEYQIAQAYRTMFSSKMNGDIKVEIIAHFKISKANTKKIKPLTNCTKKPDIDNIVKVVLDGLNKVAYEDDKQVIEVKALKVWDVVDYLQIKLTN